MKKYIYVMGLIFLISALVFYGVNLFWKGWHEKGVGSTISLGLNNGKIAISSRFGVSSPSLKISYIDNEVNFEKKEIYISIYSKYYNWINPLRPSNNEINLPTLGIYKIYYKNGDGTLDFIKEIEYK